MTDVSQVLKPTCTADVVDAVKECVVDQTSLQIQGSVDDSAPATSRQLVLDQMAKVVDYPARDMTITVQAGLPVSELQKILAEERQQLPIDVFDSSTSVGAAVAADVAGPRQYGYGTLRDYVIGIEAVDGQGRVFHAGGRVVKNVAGYDLCRLLVGSRGALAVITQVTFKLKPLPEHAQLLTFGFDGPEALATALDRLNTTAATPVVLDFSSPQPDRTARDDGGTDWEIRLGVEGSEASCQWQSEQLQQDCVEGRVIKPSESSHGEDSLTQYCGRFGYAARCPMIRCLPSQVAAIAERLAAADCWTIGHAGSGVLYAGGTRPEGAVRSMAEQAVRPFKAVVSDWATEHPATHASPLSERLLRAFDPHSVFSRS